MHIRFSSCIGMLVREEGTEEKLGKLVQVLIEPDKAKILGFFVHAPSLSWEETFLFLSAQDIAHFGTVIRIRDSDVLSPPNDLVRLRSSLEERRTILGQRIRTESGKNLGRCKDIQFETTTFRLKWLFPKKFFLWKDPISVIEVLEVRNDAIIIRERNVEEVVTEKESVVVPEEGVLA